MESYLKYISEFKRMLRPHQMSNRLLAQQDNAAIKTVDATNQSSAILEQYIKAAPSPQNALNIFQGEWASKFPPPYEQLQAGNALLFEDARIMWCISEVEGGIEGKRVLELGPLEGGHTYMLEHYGAASIIAVEANTRAYLKCLITKEILNLQRAQFLCGDFVEYLKMNEQRVDFCLASGVLYHMINPVELLTLISKVTDAVMIWTHYYDYNVLSKRPDFADKFPLSTTGDYEGFRHTLYRFQYHTALNYQGFCGGSNEYSNWLSREDILACLKHLGFNRLKINFEDKNHPNGPCFTVLAQRYRHAEHDPNNAPIYIN